MQARRGRARAGAPSRRRAARAAVPTARVLLAGLTALALVAGPRDGRGADTAPVPPAEAAPAPPQRVVSLNPSLTAITLALGAEPVLVGVDDFSARQEPRVASLPRVGGLYDPSLEAVVGLRPDLVVLVPSAEQRDFRARLQAVGIPMLALNPRSFDEVLRSIETLGARLGKEGAASERVRAIEARRAAVERAAASRPRVRLVLVLQRDPLFVVGAGSFIDEMLRAAGGDNVAAGLGDGYPRASLEWLLAAAPDLVLDASGAPEPAASYWKRWPSLPAVKKGNVVALPPGLATLPGPWLDRALGALEEAIAPASGAPGAAAAPAREPSAPDRTPSPPDRTPDPADAPPSPAPPSSTAPRGPQEARP